MTRLDDLFAKAGLTPVQMDLMKEFVAATVAATETDRADAEVLREADARTALHLLPEDRNFRVFKMGGSNAVPRLSTFGDREIPERLRSRQPDPEYPPGVTGEIADLLPFCAGDRDPMWHGLSPYLTPDGADEPTLFENTVVLPRFAVTISEAERSVEQAVSERDERLEAIAELQAGLPAFEEEIERRRSVAALAKKQRADYMGARSPAWRAAAERRNLGVPQPESEPEALAKRPAAREQRDPAAAVPTIGHVGKVRSL